MSSTDRGPTDRSSAIRAGENDASSDNHARAATYGETARALEAMTPHGFDLRVRLRREGREQPTLFDFERDGSDR